MHTPHDIRAFESPAFGYRGVDVEVDLPRSVEAETATIALGSRRYQARRHEHGMSMWTVPGVFSMYSSLGALARHMVDLDLEGILPPPERKRATARSRKR